MLVSGPREFSVMGKRPTQIIIIIIIIIKIKIINRLILFYGLSVD